MFVSYFGWLLHGFFNLHAELALLAEKDFYLDWWNHIGIDDFWRLWNRQVHLYVKSTVFIPLMERVR